MENLSEKHEDGFVLMFYYSTLKMLIPEDNEKLREVIYGIEKIKLLRVSELAETKTENEMVKSDLREEGYEEAITIRHDGNNMIIYIKEKKGITKGAFFLMEEDSSLTVLDLIGEIPIDKLFTLSTEIDMLTEARGNFLEN
jgi:hypothetical protein